MTNLNNKPYLSLAILLTILALTSPITASGHASSTTMSWTWRILGAVGDTAYDTTTGNSLTITGTATFTCSTVESSGFISCVTTPVGSGGGTYTINSPLGNVLDKGTWVETSFVSFLNWGAGQSVSSGSNTGEAGTLILVASFVSSSGTTTSGVTIEVQCNLWVAGTPPETILDFMTAKGSGFDYTGHGFCNDMTYVNP